MRTLVDHIQQMGFRLCAVYLIDSLFISDTAKFISGTLTCLAAMIQLELPHIKYVDASAHTCSLFTPSHFHSHSLWCHQRADQVRSRAKQKNAAEVL
jgi:hypothetical protein